jgi:hypothetical protein
MKSWLVEISMDGSNWTEVDRREDNSDLNRPYGNATFPTSFEKECRFVRLVSIGCNNDRNDRMVISAFEVFGSLTEAVPTTRVPARRPRKAAGSPMAAKACPGPPPSQALGRELTHRRAVARNLPRLLLLPLLLLLLSYRLRLSAPRLIHFRCRRLSFLPRRRRRLFFLLVRRRRQLLLLVNHQGLLLLVNHHGLLLLLNHHGLLLLVNHRRLLQLRLLGQQSDAPLRQRMGPNQRIRCQLGGGSARSFLCRSGRRR